MNQNACIAAVVSLGALAVTCLSYQSSQEDNDDSNLSSPIRFATYNLALNRSNPGQLIAELESGESAKAKQLAEIIQRVRPHVILLNEIDYDKDGKSVDLFHTKYLAISQNGQRPIEFEFVYTAPVNTGVDSGLDFNGDGSKGKPDDAFGYGRFPGQYGMAVLSQLPIQRDQVRTFQKFLWKDMPNAKWPIVPDSREDYYSKTAKERFRLSSKSHWDIPIQALSRTIHFVCAHPTPPVFDGPEDRNGNRNHDEIRMIADYVGAKGNYLYDDQGRSGGLADGALFVIAGDLNADPKDGDSADRAASLLLEHENIKATFVPTSRGAKLAGESSGGANQVHRGDHAADTGDFGDERVGNLRVDYVLPSKNLKIVGGGVFWPAPGEDGHELVNASDHRLVWIDVK